MKTVLSSILIGTGLIFMLFGVLGIYRFRCFYAKLLITAETETVGLLTLMAGLMVQTGFTFFTLKLLLIVLFSMFTNPLSTHAIGRSALFSGLKPKEERHD
jgi:multicomponent Na+:H+ antiporter subunit G